MEDVRKIVPVNDCRSRLMLTTCKNNVASQGGVYFKFKALVSRRVVDTFLYKGISRKLLRPPSLKEICQRILSRCEGLPLAIVVIAGVLATKDRSKVEEWEMFYGSIPSELDINERLERAMKLLFLRYYDLPYHLKICFLYMSLFPKDQKMEKTRLIRLWIAEGFVQARRGMSIEDVAEEYLKELINRSLVQVGGLLNGRLKTCRLHNLLREMILSITTEHKFIMVAHGTSNEWSEIVRYLAIHEDAKNLQVSSGDFTRLHSFLSFDSRSMSKLLLPILLSSKFLKVLDLRNAPLEEIPPEIFKLVHLRYLSLRGTKVLYIPKLIGNLEKLETLDLKNTNVTCVPKEIVKLVRLRHLLCNVLKAPSNIGALLSLQKLWTVDVGENGEEMLREIGRLSELRKLGIVGLRRGYYSVGDEVLNMESLPSLPFLEKFTLRGRIYNALDLSYCGLMDVDSLCFKAGGFQRLKNLEIGDFRGLKTVTIEEGAMPHLDTLVLSRCYSLNVLPFGIEHLTKLRLLRLVNMHLILISRCKDKEYKDYWRIAHIPQVIIDA